MANVSETHKKKRLIYLINPEFQIRFIAFTCFSSAISTSIAFAANHYFFWKMNQIGISYKIPQSDPFYELILRQEVIMNRIFLGSAVLTLLCLCAVGLAFSHRVAGPLFRLRHHLKTIESQSDLREIQFRKGDYFYEVAESFNQMVGKLNEKKSK